MANEVSCASGREPWSSGYEWQLMSKKVVGLNPDAIYWMDIFNIDLFVFKTI